MHHSGAGAIRHIAWRRIVLGTPLHRGVVVQADAHYFHVAAACSEVQRAAADAVGRAGLAASTVQAAPDRLDVAAESRRVDDGCAVVVSERRQWEPRQARGGA
jgi:hypothetical protein